jgi:Mn-containing catalase
MRYPLPRSPSPDDARAARHVPEFAKRILEQYDGPKGEVRARLALKPKA